LFGAAVGLLPTLVFVGWLASGAFVSGCAAAGLVALVVSMRMRQPHPRTGLRRLRGRRNPCLFTLARASRRNATIRGTSGIVLGVAANTYRHNWPSRDSVTHCGCRATSSSRCVIICGFG
jgi:hypothetical protein